MRYKFWFVKIINISENYLAKIMKKRIKCINPALNAYFFSLRIRTHAMCPYTISQIFRFSVSQILKISIPKGFVQNR